MLHMLHPVAEASVASDFPTAAVAIVAAVILGGLALMGFLDFRKTRERRRAEKEGRASS
jgi:hypothetical protein